MKMGLKWIKSAEDEVASTGWATLSNVIAITDDSKLDIPQITQLMQEVEKTIHSKTNRVKAAMNSFIICAGSYIKELHQPAKEMGARIGKVKVDVGDTACKIPFSPEYIEKVEKKNAIGKKRKSARCL